MIFDRLISTVIVICAFFSFNISNATNSFDGEFYDVGQGHCFIARTTKNGIIMVDAGSSSTVGIDGVSSKTNKNNQLAENIFQSIKEDLIKLRKLNLHIPRGLPRGSKDV